MNGLNTPNREAILDFEVKARGKLGPHRKLVLTVSKCNRRWFFSCSGTPRLLTSHIRTNPLGLFARKILRDNLSTRPRGVQKPQARRLNRQWIFAQTWPDLFGNFGKCFGLVLGSCTGKFPSHQKYNLLENSDLDTARYVLNF